MICPYDFVKAKTDTVEGQGIFDITLAALLSRLAKEKGDNIVCLFSLTLWSITKLLFPQTVIFDCCYSGSGTRDADSTSNIRGVDLPDDYEILDTVDRELLLDSPDQERKVDIATGFQHSGMASHVLLSACSSKQTSKENIILGRGRFTYALMSLLRNSDLNTMSYQDAISRMDDLPR